MTFRSFQKYNITEVSKRLDVLPGELARHLGQAGGLPNRLRFDEADIEKIYIEMGLKSWWEPSINFTIEDEHEKRRLIRELSVRILKNGLTHPQRYDNLLRGVGGDEKKLLRSFLNALLKMGVLRSEANISSLELRMEPNRKIVLEQIVEGSKYPSVIEELWGK
jgi:hypothetical protein